MKFETSDTDPAKFGHVRVQALINRKWSLRSVHVESGANGRAAWDRTLRRIARHRDSGSRHITIGTARTGLQLNRKYRHIRKLFGSYYRREGKSSVEVHRSMYDHVSGDWCVRVTATPLA